MLRATVDDAELTCADFTGATGLSTYRFGKANTLHRAKFSRQDLVHQLERTHPFLFERPVKDDVAKPQGGTSTVVYLDGDRAMSKSVVLRMAGWGRRRRR